MDKHDCDELIDWCRKKLAYQNKQHCSDKYKRGYEDAMKAVMSKLHSEKLVYANTQNELVKKLQEELEAAKQCIYAVEYELSNCSGSDYAERAIEEWEAKWDC